MTLDNSSPFVHELNELRRGRGLDATDLHQRIGPCLREACSIADGDPPAVARRKLVLRLTELCGGLPADLRLAALAAFGLHEEAAGEFLDRRISWLASALDRDPRTARRRIDMAFRLLDELDELVLALSVPAVPEAAPWPDITADVLFGGEIVENRQVSASHAEFVMRLPSPLRLGQRHEYGIRFTPFRSAIRPYYALTPFRRCEKFSARVRFDRDRLPEKVWRLNGVPARVIDDDVDSGDPLTVNRVGEVGLEFHELHQGLSYGLQWSFPEPREG